MSSTSSGSASPPTPTPQTRQLPGPVRSISTPMARSAAAVASTSSPSSRPSTRLSPTASAASISERCEIDLSPGSVAAPERAPCGAARNNMLEPCSGCFRPIPPVRAEFAFDSSGRSWQLPPLALRPDHRRMRLAKPEWGTKRICQSCGARFYDFGRSPIVCPPAVRVFDLEILNRARRARPVGACGRRGRGRRRGRPRASARPRRRGGRGGCRGRGGRSRGRRADDEAEEDESLIEDASELGDDEELSDVIESDIDEETALSAASKANLALARASGLPYLRRALRRGRSSVGRALEWHSRGRRFDPDRLHQTPSDQTARPGHRGGLFVAPTHRLSFTAMPRWQPTQPPAAWLAMLASPQS